MLLETTSSLLLQITLLPREQQDKYPFPCTVLGTWDHLQAEGQSGSAMRPLHHWDGYQGVGDGDALLFKQPDAVLFICMFLGSCSIARSVVMRISSSFQGGSSEL